MLKANAAYLVATLEQLPLLAGRYTNLKLANMPNGVRAGNFSLIFRAYDTIDEREVALKFFDISGIDQYRLICFEREHKILLALRGASRCVQVLSPYLSYGLAVPVSTGDPVTLPADFFATEWLEDDIEDYFSDQHLFPAIEKLRLFNDVVLAVESLHGRDVFHRDLKANNFRQRNLPEDSDVVVIDMGTAAKHDSTAIATAYANPVGFLRYSAPEAFCGFAGNRSVAPFTDMYALGCMLFELFHADDYPSAYRAINPDFETRLHALLARMTTGADANTEKKWRSEAPKLLSGLSPVTIDQSGSSVPLCIRDLLNELLEGMTASDYRNRTISFSTVRQRLWSAIRTLEHEVLAKRRTQEAANRRARKIAKAKARAAKALKYTPTTPNLVSHG